jgi:hypothetical protein
MDFPPLETQYRFATFNYIEFSELFYEKALGGILYRLNLARETIIRIIRTMESNHS